MTSFEDFYKAIYTRFSADNGSINVLNTYQVQAKTVKDNHTTHLEAYKGQPSMSLASDMHADYEYLNEITQMAVTELEAHKTGLDAFLTGMQVLAENLPDDSPHTASAKSYARIFVDFLKHGDSYVSTHHLGELEYLASLCEPLHREQIIRQNAEVAVTPNPTTGIVQLKASQEITDVVVKSSDGKILKAFVGNMQEIELGDLPNGVYFIGIRTDEGSQTIKK
ncbi:MAG: T9SS type A sorting domain-containing protein [Saprospiraceae bacterium]|nr:T9SS type A sorting domain-containing protein [Saprospiraceae bacterium]